MKSIIIITIVIIIMMITIINMMIIIITIIIIIIATTILIVQFDAASLRVSVITLGAAVGEPTRISESSRVRGTRFVRPRIGS